MKIVCLTRHLKMGGLERQLAGLAVELKTLGNEVQVVTYHSGDFFDGILEEHHIPHRVIPKGHLTAISVVRLLRHFKREKTDLVIAFGASAGRKACGVKLLWPHFRLIVSERNANPHQMPFDTYRMLFYRLADYILCNSYHQADYLRTRFPALSGKIGTIVNFVDADAFQPAAEPPRNPVFTLVTTARACARKNVLRYLEAVRILRGQGRELTVLWYGKSHNSRYLRHCEKAIRKAGLQDCFFLLPGQRDVAAIYRQADAFCLPSLYEGTSNSIAEAFCCGLPVLCSDVSDNSLYVRPGISGFLFDPLNPASIAEAIHQAMDSDETALREMGLNGRTLMQDKLSPARFRESYRQLIEAISWKAPCTSAPSPHSCRPDE